MKGKAGPRWLAFTRSSSPTADRARASLARWVLGVWLVVYAVALARSVLPLPKAFASKVPWSMFASARADSWRIVADGTRADGRRVDIPLAEMFHYTRGATSLRVPENARSMRKPWKRAEAGTVADAQRREFARWLAARMRERGEELIEIRLRRRLQRIDDLRVTYVDLGRFAVGGKLESAPRVHPR